MDKSIKYILPFMFIAFTMGFLGFAQENIALTNYSLGVFLTLFGSSFILGARHTYKTKIVIKSTVPFTENLVLPETKAHKLALILFFIVGLTTFTLGACFLFSELITGEYFLKKE